MNQNMRQMNEEKMMDNITKKIQKHRQDNKNLIRKIKFQIITVKKQKVERI